MHRVSHVDAKIANLLPAALVHWSDLFLKTFASKPETGLETCHELRAEFFGERDEIAQMVRVSVSEKNRVETIELFQ